MTAYHCVVFLLLACSCAEPGQFLEQRQKKAISDSIRQTLTNYFEDIRNQGLGAEFKYLDSSSDFFWVPPNYRSPISYDSVAVILKRYTPVYTSTDNSWEILMINPINDKLASYSGRIHSVTSDTSGKITNFTLVETGLVVKRRTGWKLLNGQTSVVEKE